MHGETGSHFSKSITGLTKEDNLTLLSPSKLQKEDKHTDLTSFTPWTVVSNLTLFPFTLYSWQQTKHKCIRQMPICHIDPNHNYMATSTIGSIIHLTRKTICFFVAMQINKEKRNIQILLHWYLRSLQPPNIPLLILSSQQQKKHMIQEQYMNCWQN